MIYLKQSTASQEVPLGPFVDATDGVTPETALTIANTDIKLWKAGATSLVSKNSGGGTHMTGGVYSCVFDATDTATLGSGCVYVAMTGALYVKETFVVLPANVYESMIAGVEWLETSTLRNDVAISGTTITVKKVDGATTQYTKTGTFTAGADVLTGLD